jgi:hypothetical protein
MESAVAMGRQWAATAWPAGAPCPHQGVRQRRQLCPTDTAILIKILASISKDTSAAELVQPDLQRRPLAQKTIRDDIHAMHKTITMHTVAIVFAALCCATLAMAEPLPVPKPIGPGGSCPFGYSASGSFCVPTRGAQDAIPKPANGTCPWGWTSSGSYCLRSGSTR